MLKPKRKISKREIKKDPFLEFINNAQQWLQDNKKIIYRVAFGVIAIVAVIYFLNNNRVSSGKEGEALLGKALLSQDIGDVENAKFQLQALVDDFDGTKACIDGKYYLGKMSYDDGEIETAYEYLNEYVNKGNNTIFMTTAYKILSEIATTNNNNEEAEKYLQKGTKSAENTVYLQEMSLLLANKYFENGKIDKAKKIVDNILNQENILFSIKKTAEELQGRIEG
ncbi:MAG: tetratricopeptide repeat protein [Candidatus Marinimicrobia bacterium]|nr:tetratricopeptide repeat protein [Candidatus Neomarinimicrobiota bacterium]